MDDPKIFDDYPVVDCTECNEYWTNACDGSKKGEKRRCKSFIAVKRLDVPQQIKSLKNDIRTLQAMVMFLALAQILNLLSKAVG